jgi:uncharacterized membrane protein HdeD (DUF308 family)
MEILIARNWWSLLLRGLLAILVGILTFIWPGITLGALVLLFGAYALLDGVFSLVGAWYASKAHERWGVLLLQGVAGIVAATITVFWPAITALALVYIISAWAVVTGVFEIIAAVRLRKYITGEWLLALGGFASVLFGFLLVAFPLAGAIVIALWVGAYALVFGALMVALSFRLRNWTKSFGAGSPMTVPVR